MAYLDDNFEEFDDEGVSTLLESDEFEGWEPAGSGEAIGPRYRRSRTRVELDITWACNLRCFNCNRSCEQAPTGESMTLDQIRRFVDESPGLWFLTAHSSRGTFPRRGISPDVGALLLEHLERLKPCIDILDKRTGLKKHI